MSLALLTGLLAGLGCVGVVRGLRPAPPTLETVAAAVELTRSAAVAGPTSPTGRPLGPEAVTSLGRGKIPLSAMARRAVGSGGEAVIGIIQATAVSRDRWRSLGPAFAVTGESPGSVASKMLVLGGAGLLVPPLGWLVGEVAGATVVPLSLAMVASLVACPVGAAVPVVDLVRRAKDRRHHVRVVVGSFVDLVVLNLAGGMGIESALLTAAQVSSDWSAQRISHALLRARESGSSSWVALSQLGEEIGVSELVELAATLQLAGTEGSRVRQSLTARAEALRRHEQADAETAANTTTERLFLPGALLLVGFLLFVGYPAFSRIIGGF